MAAKKGILGLVLGEVAEVGKVATRSLGSSTPAKGKPKKKGPACTPCAAKKTAVGLWNGANKLTGWK